MPLDKDNNYHLNHEDDTHASDVIFDTRKLFDDTILDLDQAISQANADNNPAEAQRLENLKKNYEESWEHYQYFRHYHRTFARMEVEAAKVSVNKLISQTLSKPTQEKEIPNEDLDKEKRRIENMEKNIKLGKISTQINQKGEREFYTQIKLPDGNTWHFQASDEKLVQNMFEVRRIKHLNNAWVSYIDLARKAIPVDMVRIKYAHLKIDGYKKEAELTEKKIFECLEGYDKNVKTMQDAQSNIKLGLDLSDIATGLLMSIQQIHYEADYCSNQIDTLKDGVDFINNQMSKVKGEFLNLLPKQLAEKLNLITDPNLINAIKKMYLGYIQLQKANMIKGFLDHLKNDPTIPKITAQGPDGKPMLQIDFSKLPYSIDDVNKMQKHYEQLKSDARNLMLFGAKDLYVKLKAMNMQVAGTKFYDLTQLDKIEKTKAFDYLNTLASSEVAEIFLNQGMLFNLGLKFRQLANLRKEQKAILERELKIPAHYDRFRLQVARLSPKQAEFGKNLCVSSSLENERLIKKNKKETKYKAAETGISFINFATNPAFLAAIGAGSIGVSGGILAAPAIAFAVIKFADTYNEKIQDDKEKKYNQTLDNFIEAQKLENTNNPYENQNKMIILYFLIKKEMLYQKEIELLKSSPPPSPQARQNNLLLEPTGGHIISEPESIISSASARTHAFSLYCQEVLGIDPRKFVVSMEKMITESLSKIPPQDQEKRKKIDVLFKELHIAEERLRAISENENPRASPEIVTRTPSPPQNSPATSRSGSPTPSSPLGSPRPLVHSAISEKTFVNTHHRPTAVSHGYEAHRHQTQKVREGHGIVRINTLANEILTKPGVPELYKNNVQSILANLNTNQDILNSANADTKGKLSNFLLTINAGSVQIEILNKAQVLEDIRKLINQRSYNINTIETLPEYKALLKSLEQADNANAKIKAEIQKANLDLDKINQKINNPTKADQLFLQAHGFAKQAGQNVAQDSKKIAQAAKDAAQAAKDAAQAAKDTAQKVEKEFINRNKGP